MSEYISVALRALVRERAAGRCEYCLGTCFFCNRYKGSDLSSVDINTGRLVRLFHPRRDRWRRHFRLEGSRIVPKTAVGRVTEYLLELNRPDLLDLRSRLIAASLYPR